MQDTKKEILTAELQVGVDIVDGFYVLWCLIASHRSFPPFTPLSVPEIGIPDFDIPNISMPNISISEISIPDDNFGGSFMPRLYSVTE